MPTLFRRTRYPGPIYGTKPAVRPLDLPNLVGWWDANQKVYKDAGVTLAADNDTVQQWNDVSGQGWHFSQGTAGSRPTFKTNIVNGFPVVRFASKILTISVTAGVYTPGAFMHFYFVVIPTTTTPIGILDTASSTANTFRNYNSGQWEWQNNTPVFNLSLANANPVLLEFATKQQSATNLRVVDYYRNGALVSSNGSGVAGGLMAWGPVKIGGINDGAAGYYAGDIAEMIFVCGVLSTHDRVGLENYLNLKYALW